jgi:hypothetical protein
VLRSPSACSARHSTSSVEMVASEVDVCGREHASLSPAPRLSPHLRGWPCRPAPRGSSLLSESSSMPTPRRPPFDAPNCLPGPAGAPPRYAPHVPRTPSWAFAPSARRGSGTPAVRTQGHSSPESNAGLSAVRTFPSPCPDSLASAPSGRRVGPAGVLAIHALHDPCTHTWASTPSARHESVVAAACLQDPPPSPATSSCPDGAGSRPSCSPAAPASTPRGPTCGTRTTCSRVV